MDFISEHYTWWRAGHIVFVIFWMAGLLILPRKFIYQFDAKPGSKQSKALIKQQKQLIKMVLNPSFMLVWGFGCCLLVSVFVQNGSASIFLKPAWIVKLLSISLMSGIHMFYLNQHRKFSAEMRTKTPKFWRIMNEIPAMLSIIIVITAVVFLE